MSRVLPRYIRTWRRRWSLTQKELSYLIGLTSGDSVAKYERLKRTPSLPVAFAFAVIFDGPLEELFPREYKKVEQKIIKRMRRLYSELEQQPVTKVNAHKMRLLNETIKRVQHRRHTKYEKNK